MSGKNILIFSLELDKKMQNKNISFLIGSGYAENATVGYLPVTIRNHTISNLSVSEALHNFGQAVYNALENARQDFNYTAKRRREENFYNNRCCLKEYAESLRETCPKCFSPIRENNVQTTRDDVLEQVKKWTMSTNDSSDYELIDDLQTMSLDLFKFTPQSHTLVLVENFDWHQDYDQYGNGMSRWKVVNVTMFLDGKWESNEL